MLANTFDVQQGVILEGTVVLPEAGDTTRRGFYIDCGKDSGTAILLDAQGAAALGGIKADLTGFTPEKNVDREMAFGPSPRFRLLLKHSLIEFYLNDILIECFSLPNAATGRIGLIQGADQAAIGNLKAWL